MDDLAILTGILEVMDTYKFPDAHLNAGHIPYFRKHNGELECVEDIKISGKSEKIGTLKSSQIAIFIKHMCGEAALKSLEATQELDSSFTYDAGDKDKYRINGYIDSNGYNIALRIIPSKIPNLEAIGLGETIKNMCDQPKGLILITGPTGSGKSTNLAAMIDYINTHHKKHIITIEDPIEFRLHSKKSLINQREVGKHTKGFSSAMKASLREDPDIIVIGEMRDPQTIKTAITLAETGHLVISTLHTNDTVQTVDRIVDIFPSGQQGQIRMQLALSLVGIISQRLITNKEGSGRIPAREVLVNNDATRSLIIEGKTNQIYGVLEVAAKEGMILMDKSLVYLYKKNHISKDTLMSFGRDKDSIKMMI